MSGEKKARLTFCGPSKKAEAISKKRCSKFHHIIAKGRAPTRVRARTPSFLVICKRRTCLFMRLVQNVFKSVLKQLKQLFIFPLRNENSSLMERKPCAMHISGFYAISLISQTSGRSIITPNFVRSPASPTPLPPHILSGVSNPQSGLRRRTGMQGVAHGIESSYGKSYLVKW